jgi:putative flippase GtrA
MSRRKTPSFAAPRRLWQDSRKLRFLIVGGWNTLFGYLCFYVLYLLAAGRVHYLIIAIVAHVINVIQAYVMQRRLVFRSQAQIANEFLRFNASLVTTFLFNLLAMYVLVETTALSPLAAQAIVILASLILTYVLHSRISFGRSSDRQGPPS